MSILNIISFIIFVLCQKSWLIRGLKPNKTDQKDIQIQAEKFNRESLSIVFYYKNREEKSTVSSNQL